MVQAITTLSAVYLYLAKDVNRAILSEFDGCWREDNLEISEVIDDNNDDPDYIPDHGIGKKGFFWKYDSETKIFKYLYDKWKNYIFHNNFLV